MTVDPVFVPWVEIVDDGLQLKADTPMDVMNAAKEINAEHSAIYGENVFILPSTEE